MNIAILEIEVQEPPGIPLLGKPRTHALQDYFASLKKAKRQITG